MSIQNEALAIERLLEATMVVLAAASEQDAVSLLEMAQDRARKLTTALDNLDQPKKLKAQN